VTYEQAAALSPGDRIEYTDGNFGLYEGVVEDPPHAYPFKRGLVVYVRVAGRFVAHPNIVRKVTDG
jgi:hypothetical protein